MLKPGPASFSRFGGLLLDRPVDEVGGENAIVCLDTDWDASTDAVRSRMGTTAAKDFGKTVDGIFAHSDTFLIARREGAEASKYKLVALNTALEEKAETADEAAVKGTYMSCARFGTPEDSNTYIALGAAGMRKFDGESFSTPKATIDGVAELAMPKARHLVNWPEGGNRLVVCGTEFSGGPGLVTSSGSHVWFSDAGDAESWHTAPPEANFTQLMPGDGEDIVGACAWGGQIFVFKETRMFVFYGVSLDAEGAPEFNFKTVDLGTTVLAPPSSQASSSPVCVAGDEAVYFRALDGIWATTGDEPGRISDALSGLSDAFGSADSYFSEALSDLEVTLGRFPDRNSLAYCDRRLYVPCGKIMYVYDVRRDEWLAWQSPAISLAAWRQSALSTANNQLFFTAGDTLYRFNPEASADPSLTEVTGTTGELTPIWQSGFYDCGTPDEKTLSMAKIWGMGKPSVAVAEDFGDVGTASAFTLGTSPAVAQQQKRLEQTATLFSHRFSGDGPWLVHRINRYLRETRVPATQKP